MEQHFSDDFGISLGMSEYNDFLITMYFDKIDQIVEFLLMIYNHITMINRINRHLIANFDTFKLRYMIFDDSLHIMIHRCRKSICLLEFFHLSSNFFDITHKSHIQHSIYFIQNKISDRSDVNHFLIHEIHQPSWSSNDNGWLLQKILFLNHRTSTTIQTNMTNTTKMRQLSYLISYLYHKFSRRSQYQSLSRLVIGINRMENRKQKSSSLARSCLRLSNNIFPSKSKPEDLFLDRSGINISHIFQSLQQTSLQSKFTKSHQRQYIIKKIFLILILYYWQKNTRKLWKGKRIVGACIRSPGWVNTHTYVLSLGQ